MPKLALEELATPIGTVVVVSHSEALVAVDFEEYLPRMRKLLARAWAGIEFESAERTSFGRVLADYFAGDLTAVDALPVETRGTEFQNTVWRELRRIPAGSTWTYAQLAARVGRPKAVRAAGFANSLNPVAIVQPCHRVVGANGSLTGYAGGLDRKAWLLRHEGARIA
ncbi:MAG: methylated-DNA--[protein]-cysteine S-methyltransferase [Bryobacteraceae bacterium]|nr:methylated-DNA--[protein]-cysteine S-methyltransferase [Bryobacteraceae bacterium]